MTTNQDLRDVQIFGSNNDTDQWAVIADNRFQLFDNEVEANKVFDEIVGDSIEDSCFGAAEVVEPNRHSSELAFTGAVRVNLSNCIEVDLLELKVEREALGRDLQACNDSTQKDEDSFTFEELCDMGLATPSQENKKAYILNMSKMQEWADNISDH